MISMLSNVEEQVNKIVLSKIDCVKSYGLPPSEADILEETLMSLGFELKSYFKKQKAKYASNNKQSKDFFKQLAEGLWKMWPTGEKDGKYPWKDSIPNLVERLSNLWRNRGFRNDQFTVDACLEVARRYLSKYENDKKYMKTLKYFIMKQSKLIEPSGKIKYVNDSMFADMLEGKAEVDAVQNEWEQLLNSGSLGEGMLR